MDIALHTIIAELAAGREVDEAALDKILRDRNRELKDPGRAVSKRRLLPRYWRLRDEAPETLAAWGATLAVEERLVRCLRAKPRRTASGVATITVITRPHPCSSDCLYCPSDIRMPKSYLADEPACQRAERTFFDPFLQVTARLRALSNMGHPTDKIELIVLGGTWSDYPEPYRLWFASELFRALNGDADATYLKDTGSDFASREAWYRSFGLTNDAEKLRALAAPLQARIDAHEATYNACCRDVYAAGPWVAVSRAQCATWDDLERQHRLNETASHRVVGLVVETRPDLVTDETARDLRRLGCTKIQIGLQSLDDAVLAANERHVTSSGMAAALRTLRLYGFKTHVHFMANLLGSSAEKDRADYRRLFEDERFRPDEVKIYPCCLVASSRLEERFRAGEWVPYTESELVDLLVADTLATPAYARISRMVRDISSTDIVAGNKKPNLRQLVEARIDAEDAAVEEIRHREIGTRPVNASTLVLDEVAYETDATHERFLQWVDPEGRIAGFCRLSLPKVVTPLGLRDAMIREVHVYGATARLHETGEGAQHLGLGRALVERACEIARENGFGAVNVISAIGTRGYYRSLGFVDAGMYQRRTL